MFDSTREFFENKQYKNPYILKRKSKSAVLILFRTLFIIGLSYLFLFPLLYMTVTAFQSPLTANDPSVILFSIVYLVNFLIWISPFMLPKIKL